jgi:transposase
MLSGQELTMRTIREILRLGLTSGLSMREIGLSLRVSHPTVKKYIEAVRAAGLEWPQVEAMSDEALRQVVKRIEAHSAGEMRRPMPDYTLVHQELKKPGVTLDLLWQEYKAAHPDGYQRTQFCNYYSQFAKKLTFSLRQTYKFGDAMFVDYAGQTVPIYDRTTGAVTEAEIFVAVLGASNYTYSEATPDQSLSSWIGSHVRTFESFKGVPAKIVCDNLKAGVTSACRYEPDINQTYVEMAAHYGVAVLPTRVVKPKDKAKVESGVLVVERWILAALRNRKFFSIGELNEAIRELLIRLNRRPFKKLPGSREFVYLEQELPALRPLPDQPYEYAQWKKARVNIDYHIELQGHYYSVPYMLIHEEVVARYTARTVEIFHGSRRVASHARSQRRGYHTTVRDHMPKSHQEYLDWTPTRIIDQAKKIGTQTSELVEAILNHRQYPELGYRSCLGIIRLAKTYSGERLEKACQRALMIGGLSYRSVQAILKSGLDRQPLTPRVRQAVIAHDNIRGSGYFGGPEVGRG